MMTCFIDPNKCLSWDVLLPYVQPYAYGVPDEVAIHAIRLACIEFCRRSGILHDVNILDMQAGVRDYHLETLCDYEILRIFEISVGSWSYRPSVGVTNSGGWGAGGWNPGVTGVVDNPNAWFCGPYGFYMEQPNLLILSTSISVDTPANLRAEFVVQPKQDGCSFHNYLYEAWAEGIGYGALTRLQSMQKTDWYNPVESQKNSIKFRTEIGRARTASDLNFTSGPMTMKTERWV